MRRVHVHQLIAPDRVQFGFVRHPQAANRKRHAPLRLRVRLHDGVRQGFPLLPANRNRAHVLIRTPGGHIREHGHHQNVLDGFAFYLRDGYVPPSPKLVRAILQRVKRQASVQPNVTEGLRQRVQSQRITNGLIERQPFSRLQLGQVRFDQRRFHGLG